ncbi:MAG: 3-methyl-2-oxobutanoate dehydrogenase subunit VorB [Desulfobacterium sp. 4572_20]|nr:3-methyl-2-oxobutanoate dehydrogenase subunit VorB [Deltaproteobacteria bacterium]OQY17399.1 MAG: 3-methyl-2-oxobutanoate dehydrogenase subunit VorB [Desulfobacterium sp. 4572_20]RLB25959.1 MAG: 3-methyl-2-oxobutanoate dehydrogenase subunit beta [Deltaproteobacteria bacterium]
MSEKMLLRGSHVIAEAAVRAGCRFYFGYPITPQNELTEYMANALASLPDGVFIQSESELAAINMVIGVSMTGKRVMTSSSSPGISLKQEGISYLSGQELPAVIINTMRGGPGLGNIAPAQGDYLQATRGGGHGDYRTIVLAPGSGQELADITRMAFEYADRYRIPVIILGDGMMGQMMEPVEFPDPIDPKSLPPKPWVLDGAEGRPSRIIKSLILDTSAMEEHNWKLFRKYEAISREVPEMEQFLTDDAHLAVIAYGTASRIAKGAIKRVREMGLKVGLLRPKTLWPFPKRILLQMSRTISDFLVFEMSAGQMLEDVKLSLEGRGRIHFYGRPGGIISTPDEIAKVINNIYFKEGLERE